MSTSKSLFFGKGFLRLWTAMDKGLCTTLETDPMFTTRDIPPIALRESYNYLKPTSEDQHLISVNGHMIKLGIGTQTNAGTITVNVHT